MSFKSDATYYFHITKFPPGGMAARGLANDLPDSNKIESERYKAPAVRFKEVEPHLSRTAGALWMAASFLCNHPKSTVLFKFFALSYFAGKKAMFNLNENNRIVMSQHPSDMRIGVNGMCGQVRKVGLDPSNGDVYIFVGRSRQLMKILHWERGGYVMYYKRLEQGRFHPRIFLREGIGFRTMRWDELVLLMEGISPKVARRKRFPNPNGKLELSRKK